MVPGGDSRGRRCSESSKLPMGLTPLLSIARQRPAMSDMRRAVFRDQLHTRAAVLSDLIDVGEDGREKFALPLRKDEVSGLRTCARTLEKWHDPLLRDGVWRVDS